MFAKTLVVAAVAALSTVSASPVAKRTSYKPVSFNWYGGYGSMYNFDNFYGAENYSGYHNSMHEDSGEVVVCHSQQVEIIQQQLAVLREYAKKIVTEQICEVEVQTVVYQQFVSGLHDFSSDISRHSGRSVGYDGHVTSLIGHLHDSEGNIAYGDLGFQGSDVGSQYVVPSGNNWNDASSPASVGAAFDQAQQAGGISDFSS